MDLHDDFGSDRYSTTAAYLAFAGLFAVAILSMRDLNHDLRSVLWAGICAIWALYAFLLVRSLSRFRSMSPSHYPIVAIETVTVLFPFLVFVLPMHGFDPATVFGIWLLRPLTVIPGVRLIGRVIRGEARNLLGVMSIFLLVLFGAALIAHVLEGQLQPKQFGSIPSSMWWAVVTLTTTGYGDEIPVTSAGRVLGAVVMMSGIVVFGLWAGIIASGFAQEIRRRDFSLVWRLVARTPVFASVDGKDLAGIVEALRPRRYSSGSVIFKKGTAGTEMYFIVEGRVRIDAKTKIELGPGQYFGEMALVTGEPRTATVVAATPVSLLTLHVADFQHLFGSDSELARTIRNTALTRARANTPEESQ